MGHAVNKILKDMITKARQLEGFDALYVPGWDCHGLPIENAIEKKFGRNLGRDEMQAKSRAFAAEQIGQQMADFQRLGVLGEWDHPYKTMDFANEAGELRAFKRVIERGFVYRGLKPVYWCFDCGSSLAEFEIEYADKKSHTVDVAFKAHDRQQVLEAFGRPDALGDVFAVIWTTTAWTIPANQAINLNPALDYALVDTDRALDHQQLGPGPEPGHDDVARPHRAPAATGEHRVAVAQGGRHRGSPDEDGQHAPRHLDSTAESRQHRVGSIARIIPSRRGGPRRLAKGDRRCDCPVC